MQKIAKIIPLRKLPRTLEVFDYLIPENLEKNLKIGTIVKIPFKQQKIAGLVYQIIDQKQKPKYPLKKIDSIIFEKLLAAYQINLLKWFSDFYHYSLASTARLLTPQIPCRKTELKLVSSIAERKQIKKNIEKKDLILLKNDLQKIENLAKKIHQSKDKGFLFINQKPAFIYKFYLNLIDNHLQNKQQILILFPIVDEVYNFYKYLPQKQRSRTLILDRSIYKTSKTRYLDYWKQVKDKKKLILLGTRSSIFFNLQNTQTIIVDKEEADDYKQWDQNPRYLIAKILFEQLKYTNTKLIISGFSPRPETYFQAQKRKFKLVVLGNNIEENQIQRINFSSGVENYYLTPNLEKFIKNGLRKNEKILLIVNKRGLASYLECSDCETTILCPECQLPLTVYADNKLFCHHCLKNFPIPAQCSNCKSIRLKAKGIGSSGFENLIKTKFASKNIFVGLPSILNSNFNQKIDKAAFVYFDSLFYLPDFSHTFKIYSMLRNLAQTLFDLNPKIKILLQSNFLENFAVSDFNKPVYQFYKKELEIRKKLKYPPYSTLIKIIVRDKLNTKAQEKIQRIYNNISRLISKNNISPPFPVYAQKIRNQFVWQIAIKIFNQEQENKIIKKIPDFAIIDKGPLNLL